MPERVWIASQEERFSRAFAAGDLEPTRELYHPDVVYVSPTVRLFDWPARIEGVDRTLEFIGRHCPSGSSFLPRWPGS